jgi:uncharacterized protein (TIGR00369 family)
MLELPHTLGCLVCGRDNPLGLHLSLHVDPSSGIIRTTYLPLPAHIGFVDIIHGGVLATVLDEAMVWAATWSSKRFCVCGEMTVRFRKPGRVGEPLRCETRVTASRARLITTEGDIRDAAGEIVATASGKYVPRPVDQNAEILKTLISEPATAEAYRQLHVQRPGC